MENKKNEHGIIDMMVHKVREYKKPIFWAVIAAVALAAGCTIYSQMKEKAYQQQWGALFLAELNFVESADKSLSSMEEFVAQYDGTKAGAYGSYTLGNAYYQSKDYAKAEEYFKKTIKDANKELAALGEVSLIATFIAQNNFGTAISQADSFLAKNPAHYAAVQVKQYKALALDLSAKKDEAKALYTEITADYPNTYYAAFAALRLEELK